MTLRPHILPVMIVLAAALPGLLLSPCRTSAQPQFSSGFTHLHRDCRNALRGEGEGEDIPLKCKGVGRYYVFVYYSAHASHIAIKTTGREDFVYVTPAPFDFAGQKDSVIEWRLADGKPFAVIVKVARYNVDKAQAKGDNPFQPQYKIGDFVLVKGLFGFEPINYSLNTKTTPDALARARQLADAAYLQKRP